MNNKQNSNDATEQASTANNCYTPEQQAVIDKINKMGHYEMCYLWRFAPSGHPYFDDNLPYAEIFKKRLFKHFGGFTPEISKSLRFNKEKEV